jgi:hypothetical protein
MEQPLPPDFIQEPKLKPIILWKDIKFIIGVILVLLSLVLGFYAKGIIIVKLNDPHYITWGISIWALSWVPLIIGIFLVGMGTIKAIQYKINFHVIKSASETYNYTKDLPKKGIEQTKKLHRKGKEGIIETKQSVVRLSKALRSKLKK